MIANYLHYNLGSSFEDNLIDLRYVDTLDINLKYYKSDRYSELYTPNRIIPIQLYLGFVDNKLQMINYFISREYHKDLMSFVNSFANSENEELFKDPFIENLSYSCVQNSKFILLEELNKEVWLFRITPFKK